MTKTIVSRQGTVWTREEVRTLRSLFRNSSNTDVAQMLDRTPKAVERKASTLGLKKTKRRLKSLGRKV